MMKLCDDQMVLQFVLEVGIVLGILRCYSRVEVALPEEGGDLSMAFSYTNSKGQTYYLHAKDVTLKNGRKQTIYFFARDVRSGSMDAVPAGYKVVETKRTGMPVLKKG